MIGLIFATHTEARPFLTACRAVSASKSPFAVYRTPLHPGMRIVISGMGKVAAAAAGQALILAHRADRLVNAGACGALRDDADLAVGRLVWISEALEGDHEIIGKRPQPIACTPFEGLDGPGMRLVTSDRPVFDVRKRTLFAALGDVVDMEGAAIARVAGWYQVPCTMIKGVSDTAGPMDRRTLLKNLNTVSERIAQQLWRQVMPEGTTFGLTA